MTNILKDPVEKTVEFETAMKKVQKKLDELYPNFPNYICYSYWTAKKNLLAKEGIQWKTPVEMNPGIVFD